MIETTITIKCTIKEKDYANYIAYMSNVLDTLEEKGIYKSSSHERNILNEY